MKILILKVLKPQLDIMKKPPAFAKLLSLLFSDTFSEIARAKKLLSVCAVSKTAVLKTTVIRMWYNVSSVQMCLEKILSYCSFKPEYER